MLHVDIPNRSELESLIAHRAPGSISIYLPTTPITPDAQADRIALKNQGKAAIAELRAANTPVRDVRPLEEALDDLVDDEDFWAHQAHSLAIFMTVERTITFRLPNALSAITEVSDRFHVKPLLRSVTFPNAAYVLAIGQGGGRLVEVCAELPAAVVHVPDMPDDAADAVGQPSIRGRAPKGRIQGSEGRKVRMSQYARAVDSALRHVLQGKETPLILAATAPLNAIVRSVNSYPHLAAEGIDGNVERMTEGEIATLARPIIDRLNAAELAKVHEKFTSRKAAGRTTTDLAAAAKAATHGAIETLFVDIDEVIPGTVDEAGVISKASGPSAATYGIVDEIAGRAFMTGARVLGVRRQDIPGQGSLAATLRYAV